MRLTPTLLFRQLLAAILIEAGIAIAQQKPFYKVVYQVRMIYPYWLMLKDRRLKRDGYRCKICGSTGGEGNPLQLHHSKGTGRLQGWLGFFRELNGTVILCDKCHVD